MLQINVVVKPLRFILRMLIENLQSLRNITSTPVRRIRVLEGMSLPLQQLFGVTEQAVLLVGRRGRILLSELLLPEGPSFGDILWWWYFLLKVFTLV